MKAHWTEGATGTNAIRTLLGVLAAAALVLAFSPLANATAQAEISIASPSGGYVATHTPTFEGVTDGHSRTTSRSTSTRAQTSTRKLSCRRRAPFCRRPAAPGRSKRNRCPTGTYTAQAGQTNTLGETSTSEPPVTFHVDTTQAGSLTRSGAFADERRDAEPRRPLRHRCRRRSKRSPQRLRRWLRLRQPSAHAVRDPDWRGVVDERRPGARRRHVHRSGRTVRRSRQHRHSTTSTFTVDTALPAVSLTPSAARPTTRRPASAAARASPPATSEKLR